MEKVFKSRDLATLSEYKHFRNKVKNEVRNFNCKYQEKVASSCKTNSKLFCKYINSKCSVNKTIGNIKYVDESGTECLAKDAKVKI